MTSDISGGGGSKKSLTYSDINKGGGERGSRAILTSEKKKPTV